MRQLSSGDLLADRRFAYAEMLLAEGDDAAAADLLAQVLDLVPGWAPAWMALGAAEERRGGLTRAVDAYRRAAALDATGLLGAQLHLDRLCGGTAPVGMAASYVAALFDDYAPRFDHHLVEGLAYRGPALLVAALQAAGAPQHFEAALDLGCGTGLMGRAIREQVTVLDGVDLSCGMVEQARRSGCYEALEVGDAVAALGRRPPCSLDLVLAADVFVYLGVLEPVLAGVARVLRPGGTLAFTTQLSRDEPVRLGADLRFAHSALYVEAALHKAGLQQVHGAEASTRTDRGAAVPGLVIVARTP